MVVVLSLQPLREQLLERLTTINRLISVLRQDEVHGYCQGREPSRRIRPRSSVFFFIMEFYLKMTDYGPLFTIQPSTSRDQRRLAAPSRSRSAESEMNDDLGGEAAFPPSPPSLNHSVRSESPAPSNWTAAHEQAAQEEYESELAENYLYELTRRFATATRALAMYDCCKCLDELEQLPHVHQQSPWVLAMVGRAHYERLEYGSVRV
jgi:hypothetical protein